MSKIQILIIDLGSQYTLVIGRVLRELGYRSVILSPKRADAWLESNEPKAVILSGGSASVHDEDCPVPPERIISLGVPILGICLGMQWIAQRFGGKVTSHSILQKEYGPVFIKTDFSPLFEDIPHRTLAWASHGDSIQTMPPGFYVMAKSEDHNTIAGIANHEETIFGIQFHPEVKDTQDGERMLENFLRHADCEKDWNAEDVIDSIRQEIREAVTIPGEDGTVPVKAILGLSGGVDSSVTAKLLQPVFGDNLLCIVIDSGFFRENELDEIIVTAEQHLKVNYRIIDAADRFYDAVSGTIDAEEKRKRFKVVYQSILEEVAEKFGAHFMIQGSLATDFIESGKAGGSALIKSHHNIGIDWNIKELHPLRSFFKYEVRAIGTALNLPDSITNRQPFPGPGLMVRIVGVSANRETADILRYCDRVIRDIAEDYGIYDKISQLVVALNGTKTVGVKGDERVYGYGIIARPIVTQDFMTCGVYDFSRKIIDEMMKAVTKHPMVNRFMVDYTTKPPGTTEME